MRIDSHPKHLPNFFFMLVEKAKVSSNIGKPYVSNGFHCQAHQKCNKKNDFFF
jgi:hypothetical protein